MHVVRFVAFLAAYLLYLVATTWYGQKGQKNAIEGKWLLASQIEILLLEAPFFLCMYFLSGFRSLRLVILFTLVAEVGVVTSAICRGFLYLPDDKFAARILWAGWELGVRNVRVLIGVILTFVIVTIIYPLRVGAAYFSHTTSSAQMTLIAFRYSLVAFVFVAYAMRCGLLVAVLVSENLDQRTRKMYLAAEARWLVNVTLFLSLAFWAIGYRPSAVGVVISDIPFGFSLKLVLLLVAFYLGSIVIPFAMGSARAKNWNYELANKRRQFIRKFRDILEGPTGSLLGSRLKQLGAELTRERTDFADQDAVQKLLSQSDEDIEKAATPAEKPVAAALSKSKTLDPRFVHLDELGRYASEVEEVAKDLESREAGTDQKDAAEAWADVYTTRAEELNAEMEAAKDVKTSTAVAMAFVLTSLGGALLSEMGKWAWTIASDFLPKAK